MSGSGDLTELFFSDQTRDIGRAKAICASCPVIAACLDGALARRKPWGAPVIQLSA
ncbi:MAG: WhiB family transcriptional regulator [Acidimicrobiales bacterium]